jgi:hypothetical protein
MLFQHNLLNQEIMKNKFKYLLVVPLLAGITLTSCDKDDPEIPNEEELITTLIYTLTPTGSGPSVAFTFRDLDGDGGNPPVISVPSTLIANHQYTGEILLLNETESPADTISNEVEEEAEEHQFFFAAATANVTVAYADADGNGNPIGLATTVTTGDASTGTLTITLRHEPDKDGSNVSSGDITNAGGETDIEVTFDVTIQ